MKNIKKIIFSLFVLMFLIIFTSCQYSADNLFYSGNSVSNRVQKLTNLEEDFSSLPDEYTILVLTDIHVGSIKKNPPAIPYEKLYAWIENLSESEKPKFCLILGDVADTASDSQYQKYVDFTTKLQNDYGIKTFNAVGNHDVYQSGWEKWKKYCYPYTSFYYFDTPGFTFYSFDTATGTVGSKQLNLFKDSLYSNSKPKIIFTHYPLYTENFFFCLENTTERNLLMKYFRDTNVKLYLAGHLHNLEEYNFTSYKGIAVPSFRYESSWGFVTVNENAKTAVYHTIR